MSQQRGAVGSCPCHRIGIWSSYQSGKLQNLEPHFDELYQAIEQKVEANGGAGTAIDFYDYDGTRGFDKFKTSETNPGANVAFTVTVRKTGSDLEFLPKNVLNATDPDRVYEVDYVYGGGVKKQRYVTQLKNSAGFYGAMLPVQFQHDGKDTDADRTAKIRRDYNAFKWYDWNTKAFKTPAPARSTGKWPARASTSSRTRCSLRSGKRSSAASAKAVRKASCIPTDRSTPTA